MNTVRRITAFCFLAMTVSIVAAFGQTAPPASATGHITAYVITTLAAEERSQLSFGRFSPGPAGGELIITPESTVMVRGTVFPGNGSRNAASFYVTGDPGVAYTITLPPGPVTITHQGTARTMNVIDWTSWPEPTPGAGMLQDGSQMVYVGATLKIGTLTDNPVGTYTGTFVITFDFN